MVTPSTESILNQMTNLAMDIAIDYVLPASPMSDVGKSDLFEFERDVVKSISGDVVDDFLSTLARSAGTAKGCCGRPPSHLGKKNSYMGATVECDACDACLSKHMTAELASSIRSGFSPDAGSSGPLTPPSSSNSSPTSTDRTSQAAATAETTMDISWCQFDGCEFDTADNSYLDICDWIFYADRYSLSDENREKVQKAFQMVPPGEVTGYVAQPPAVKEEPVDQKPTAAVLAATTSKLLAAATAASSTYSGADDDIPVPGMPVDDFVAQIKSEIKCESDDDYLWTSDNHLQPIILKATPNADILQITELDHSYLQTPVCSSASSSTVVSPIKHHPTHVLSHLLGLVTPPPSRSQSSEEEEIDVVNDTDSWDAPRAGPTMADIMRRGIVKKREAPVTKYKQTVKRKYNKTAGSSTYPAMPPPPPKKLCGGLSLLDRFKKDTNWKDASLLPAIKHQPFKEEPLDDDDFSGFAIKYPVKMNGMVVKPEPVESELKLVVKPVVKPAAAVKPAIKTEVKTEIKSEPMDDGAEEEYDADADFELMMKNEPDDLFDDECDDENDMDWDKVMRVGGCESVDSSMRGGRYGKSSSSSYSGNSSSSGSSSSCGSSSSSAGDGRKKKKKKKKTSNKSSSKHQQQQGSGKKIKYENGYSYKTKLMDPVKRALHNDLEKSRRVETSMLFMNLSMQVSFLDDNRKIPSKLSILRGAKRECDLTMLEERRLLSEKHVMQQKQRMLRERLFELRREQYHRRYGKTNGHSKPHLL